jgi:hypothetical protein
MIICSILKSRGWAWKGRRQSTHGDDTSKSSTHAAVSVLQEVPGGDPSRSIPSATTAAPPLTSIHSPDGIEEAAVVGIDHPPNHGGLSPGGRYGGGTLRFGGPQRIL